MGQNSWGMLEFTLEAIISVPLLLAFRGFWYVGTLNLLRWGQCPIDWDEAPYIGEEFDDILVGFWWGLRWFKKVLVPMLDPSL